MSFARSPRRAFARLSELVSSLPFGSTTASAWRNGTKPLPLAALTGLLACLLVVSAAKAAPPITIMPMGDSITLGTDYLTNSTGGYRDPLYRELTAAGVAFTYVGAASGDATTLLTNNGQTAHNGFGAWHIRDLDANLEGVAAPIGGGDSNLGGYLLTGGHGTGRAPVSPDVILLHIGANDLLQYTGSMNSDLYTLVTHIHALSPKTTILVAAIVPINSSTFTAAEAAYNTYIQTQLVPALPYTRYVDINSAFLNADGSVNAALLGTDNVHPDEYGYPLMAQKWAAAVESLEGVSPTAYALSVVGGTGSGLYPAGTVVTIGTTATTGFTGWTPVTTALNNPYSAYTTYTMAAAAATLTANPTTSSSSSSVVTTSSSGTASTTSSTSSVPTTSTTTSTASTGTGTNLGTFSLLNQSVSSGNALGVAYGQSFDGNSTITFWQSSLAQVDVLSMGSGQYEIVEDIGHRCLTGVGSAVDVYACTGATSQLWTLTGSASSGYVIKSAVGLCVSASSFSPVTVQACSGGTTQSWAFSGATALSLTGASTTSIPTSTTSTSSSSSSILYALTVVGGTGTGSYTAGTAVAVVANAAPSGSVFAGWTGATAFLANASSASTTFRVSAASAAITATYAALPVTSSTPAAGKDLGNFQLVNQGNATGDTMTLMYGKSSEGGGLVGYWQNNLSLMDVLSMGNGQYELIEGTGRRCVTATGTTVTVTTCTAAASQLFTLTPVANSVYTLKSGAGVCVALPGAFTTMVAQTCNASSSSQMWLFSGATTLSLTN